MAAAHIQLLVTKFQKLAGVVQGLAANQTVTLVLKAAGVTLFSQTLPALSLAQKFLTPAEAALAKANALAAKIGSAAGKV